jgi:hypothetical protein
LIRAKQFARIERLGEVVVGTHLQPDDAIDLFAHGGEHDHRQVGVGSHPPAPRQQLADLAIVIDDQDVRRGLHDTEYIRARPRLPWE